MLTILAAAAAAVAQPTTAPPDASVSLDNGQILHLPDCGADHLNPATMVHLRMARGTATKGTEALVEGNSGKILGYTRIRIFYRSCGGDQREYVPEKRDDLSRFFLGKHAKKILTIDAHVTPLDVKANEPLASLNRDSTKKGEGWSTDIDNNEVLLPYFRIDRGTVIALDAKLHSTRDYDSSIASDALDLVRRASDLISPTTALITTENKDRFNKAATFVDTAVNGMLKVSIDERVRLSSPVVTPQSGEVLAVITLRLPRSNDVYASAIPEKLIGQWVVYTEPARASMLDDVGFGQPIARKAISAAGVLNYLVDDKKTLREAFSGVKNLVSARDALVGASAAESTDKARTLCRSVAGEALSLGLTPVDAGAAAWAYLADLALPKAKMKNAEAGCADVEFYPPAVSS